MSNYPDAMTARDWAHFDAVPTHCGDDLDWCKRHERYHCHWCGREYTAEELR